MNETAQLLAEIEAFLERTGMAATTFGQKILRNSKLLDRLRAGGTVTLETAEIIRRFMHEHDDRLFKPRKRGNEQLPRIAA